MTIMRPSFGLTENCTLEPPVSTPISRRMAMRGVAHQLVFLVGQRLRRGHRDAVAGVDAHRVEVLDAAHDDAVVGAVADDFHLVLLPADQALLDQQFLGRRQVQPALADLLELFRVVGDAAAGAAQREAGADDHREAGAADLGLDALLHRPGFFQRVRDAALGRVQPDGRSSRP
jgi:hypothetical protein